MPFQKRLVDDPTGAKSDVDQFTSATPNIRNAFIAMYLATGGEMQISELLKLIPRAYEATFDLAILERAAGATSGKYSVTSDKVNISYTDESGTDITTQVQAIRAGFGLEIGNNVFVIEFINNDTAHREFNGFWVNGTVDPTTIGSSATIKVIAHELRSIRYLTAQQLKALLPEIQETADALLEITPRVMTHAERDTLKSLQGLTADLVLDTEEAWVAATDGGIAALESTATQLNQLRANQEPTGISSWVAALTTTEDRVIVVRVPGNAHLPDYRIIFGDDDPIRLNALAVYATGSNFAYLATRNLRETPPGQIRLQYHGSDTHTRFIGALADTIMARLLPDPSGAEAGQVPQVNTALTGYVLGALAGGGLSTDQVNALIKLALDHYTPHTPDRGDTLPAHLEPQGTYVLEKTSHWSDKFYRFYPVWRNIDIGGQTHRDIGTIEVPISSDWTVFENTDNPNPAIFSATRVAGMVYRQTAGPTTGYRWYPKIIMDRALFPEQSGAYDYSGLSIRMRTDFGSHFDTQLFQTTFDADDQTGSVTEIVSGGKTYVCFRPNPNAVDSRTIFDNVTTNETWLSFQILKSKSASPVFPPTDPQFLSDDAVTPWVDGDEFETGLYEGDANGHPQARILPPLDVWNAILARLRLIPSGTDPDPRAGEDGQWWINLRSGKIWQKQSGTWELFTDLVLQSELQSAIDAIEASGGADGRFIIGDSNRPANNLGKVGDVYIRRLTLETGFYEKTGEETWTYRFGLDKLPNRPAFNARDRLGLFWDGNALGWTEAKAVFAELSISASLTIPQEDATAIPLTYASALTDNHNATGIIGRAAAGNAITLKAGVYTFDIDINVSTSTSSQNSRSNIEFSIYNGNTLLKAKRGGYIRSLNDYNEQVASARFTIGLSSDATIQVRVKMHDNDAGDPPIVTQSGSSMTVTRIGI